jgi:hypothetical protein
MSYKIGVLLCSYSLPEYIHDCLRPWIEARQTKLGGHEFVISAISVPFKEYRDKAEEDAESPRILQEYKDKGLIDYLFTEPKWEEEKVVRNTALNPLLEVENCDIIFLLNVDEEYRLEEIEKMFSFVVRNPFIPWFRGSLKNYIFDRKTYLREPFCPARIYRTRLSNLRLYGFRFDNEMIYIDEQNRIIDHQQLPSLTIPKHICFATHWTWLSSEATKRKTEYQHTRWGSSMCGYKWDYERNRLVFNPEFYMARGLTFPETISE